MLFSVSVIASGDRDMTREEIVELADAVAGHSGVASGIGTTNYGARLIVEADDRTAAVDAGLAAFAAAATRAGLPSWPISHAGALADGEDEEDGVYSDQDDSDQDGLDQDGLDQHGLDQDGLDQHGLDQDDLDQDGHPGAATGSGATP